ncbi:MAG: hypothetical protein ABR497_05865 [Kiritimatiellia bacterium]|nr:hypothetical protein [Lentisphaerota bacterium]
MQTEIGWQVDTAVECGNVAAVRVVAGANPEVRFSPAPRGVSPLWFSFRIKAQPGAEHDAASGKLRLVLEHYDTLAGAETPHECCPVFRPAGQWWMHLPAARPEQTQDGRMDATWTLNCAVEYMDVALGFPYTDQDLHQFVDKSRAAWQLDCIGVSAGGRELLRLSNAYAAGGKFTGGLYLLARQRGCDMPAAWVLDGMLQRLASAKNNPFMIWAVPLADPDAVQAGAWFSAPDMTGDWGLIQHHEVALLLRDLARWRAACRPALVINLQAAPLRERAGIYCELPDAKIQPEMQAQALKWAHVMQHKLGAEFAADPFVREDTMSNGRLPMAMAAEGICAMTLHVPWAAAGTTIFSQKKYREVGRRLADALIEKRH